MSNGTALDELSLYFFFNASLVHGIKEDMMTALVTYNISLNAPFKQGNVSKILKGNEFILYEMSLNSINKQNCIIKIMINVKNSRSCKGFILNYTKRKIIFENSLCILLNCKYLIPPFFLR